MQVLIDYLTMTSKIHSQQYFLDQLGVSGSELLELPGRYGWRDRLYYRGVSVYFGGSREDVCLELSGTGCRTVEELSGHTFGWLDFFRSLAPDIRSQEVHVSRLDIAGDDHDGILDYHRMTLHCKHRRYICKARWRIWTDGDEQCIYFGSPSSDRRLRIYNKAMEQAQDCHWMRVEFQMRDDNALSFLLNWLRVGEVGFCYSGVLRDFLRFTRKAPDSNRNHDRLEVMPWWDRFLGAVSQCPQLYLESAPYTLMDVEHFLKRQAGSSLKLWLEANNGDLSDIVDMIDGAKLNRRQQELLIRIRLNEASSVFEL